MKSRNGGFTIIELVVTITIGAILLDVALSTSGPALDRMSVTSARTTFAALHARARARAVERGRTVSLFVDPATDSAWVYDNDEVVEAIAFGTASGIDVTAGSRLELCLSPRGYADRDCNSFSSAVEVGFARNGASASVELRPLGQLVMED
jgi:prepilin-type N-terminal cleavage/methylation domain-containing protein